MKIRRFVFWFDRSGFNVSGPLVKGSSLKVEDQDLASFWTLVCGE